MGAPTQKDLNDQGSHLQGHVISSNENITSSGVKAGYSPSFTEDLSNTILLLRSIV